MADDGGFEGDFVNEMNSNTEDGNPDYYVYRRKQHRFSSQDIDVLVDSNDPDYYCGVECKSKQVDVKKMNKDNNESEAKIYFSQAFSVDKDGNHQIETITDFLNKTGRRGILAIAYRRGRGRKVHYYALPWEKVVELFEDDEYSGIPKRVVESCGVELFDRKENGKKKDDRFEKIFEL